MRHCWRKHLQALYRRQDRDCGGDHAIAVKQCGAKYADPKQNAAQGGLVFNGLRSQGKHRHQTALAVIVCTQNQGHILERDDDRQRPNKQRQNTQNVLWRECNQASSKHFLQRVQHAGTDIAIDDAKRTNSQGR